MTDQTRIERAGEAIANLLADDNDWTPEARAAFESIDTDELANVLSTLTTCDGQPNASELHRRQAHAVKNWLTGKDNQQ